MKYGDWLEALQEFNELAGDNWKMILNRLLRKKVDIEQLDKNILAAFKVFVCSVKRMILIDQKEALQEVKEILHNQILYHLLERYEENLSDISCDLEKLCLLYLVGEKTAADDLVTEIFNNVIVRKDEDFFKKYKMYSMDSEEELQNVSDMLDSLVMAGIRTRSSGDSFRKFLEKSIPEDILLVDQIVYLYEKNFTELRNRYLIELEEKTTNREQ